MSKKDDMYINNLSVVLDVAGTAGDYERSPLDTMEDEASDRFMNDCINAGAEFDSSVFLSKNEINQALVKKIMAEFAVDVKTYNAVMTEKADRLRMPQSLGIMSIRNILKNCCDIRVLKLSSQGNDGGLLGIKIRDKFSKNNGIYVIQTEKECKELSRIVKNLKPSAGTAFVKDVLYSLLETAEEIKVNDSKWFAACNNGIYSMKTCEFTEWDSDDFDDLYSDVAFINKLPINFNPNATNVVLHNDDDGTDWDFETHLEQLFEGEQYKDIYIRAIWEIISHSVRQYGGKIAWFWLNGAKSMKGGGGKSTVLVLLKELLGKEKCCIKNIEQLSRDEPTASSNGVAALRGKIAIMADESKTASKPLENDNVLKVISRGGDLDVREKYVGDYSYAFFAVMIQAMNDIMRVKDSTEATFRNVRCLPFNQSFTKDSGNRDYIIDEYVKNVDVLEYVLYKALTDDKIGVEYSSDVLTITEAKTTMMRASQPVYDWLDDVFEGGHGNTMPALDFIPKNLLYDMYCNKYEEENHERTRLHNKGFENQLRGWISQHSDEWAYQNKDKKLRMHCNGAFTEKMNEIFTNYNAGSRWVECVAGRFSFTRQALNIQNLGNMYYIGTERDALSAANNYTSQTCVKYKIVD